MGMAVIGVPASRAAAGSDPSTGDATVSTSATAAAAPVDLDRRIEALEMELAELKTELSAKKTAEPATATPGVEVASPAQGAAKPPDKVSIASLLGPTSLSGFVDLYYQANFNHPAGEFTALRSFEGRDKSINLNMVELILDKAPDATAGAAGRTGYHVSLGAGDAMTAIDATERASSGAGPGSFGYDQYLKEAYFSYLAPVGKGLQIDFGKFVTPMGAEVIESKDNWNYSRSILFSYAIPYFHFGARAKYTFNTKYALTGFVTNGWNNVADNNAGKTYGASFAWTPNAKWTITPTYLAGPELPTGSLGTLNVDSVWRQTWDMVAMYTVNPKFSVMANYDYGRGDRTSALLNVKPVYWTGIAGYAKYTWDANDYVAGRYEYYDDYNGYTTSAPLHTHYNEFTVTYQRTIESYLLARAEFRRDMASSAIFPISTFANGVKYQNVATIGLIFLFDSRNAK